MRRAMCRKTVPDDGFVATELVLGVGVLLLPVAALVLTVPAWSQRQTTARAVAREVARRVASEASCDSGMARSLSESMAVNLGLAPDELNVALGCRPEAALTAGSSVEVSVTVRMPAVHLPVLGSVGEWTWTAHHRQPVDRYASAP